MVKNGKKFEFMCKVILRENVCLNMSFEGKKMILKKWSSNIEYRDEALIIAKRIVQTRS